MTKARLVDKVWFNMVVLGIYYLVVPFLLAWGMFSLVKFATGYSAGELAPVGQASIIISYFIVISCHKLFFTERTK